MWAAIRHWPRAQTGGVQGTLLRVLSVGRYDRVDLRGNPAGSSRT